MGFDIRSFRRVWLLAAATAISAVLLALATGCSVTVGGVRYPYDTEAVTLTQLDDKDLDALAELKQLRTLDVTALALSADDVDGIRSKLGSGVDVVWSVPINGGSVPSNVSQLSLSGVINEGDAEAIRYFTGLKEIAFSDAEVNDALLTAVHNAEESHPDAAIVCSVRLYGVPLDGSTELLDLNDVPVDSPDPLCKALELFPKLRTVEMCGCGLSNEVMQGLREAYPEVKFVWSVSFLTYTVRTDIQVFSTLAADDLRPGNSKNFAPLFQYCTELRALDLGHMSLTDLSGLRNLKHLHTLILADNYITDISPLADLKELVYLELFENRIADVSPLAELPDLEDVNLCYNTPMKNPTVLTGCHKLKRLYISYCGLDAREIETLKNGIPQDCEFNYTALNCVHEGWRTTENARNTKIREAFKNWRRVKAYPTWDNIIYE